MTSNKFKSLLSRLSQVMLNHQHAKPLTKEEAKLFEAEIDKTLSYQDRISDKIKKK